jgi:hypothetical protein
VIDRKTISVHKINLIYEQPIPQQSIAADCVVIERLCGCPQFEIFFWRRGKRQVVPRIQAPKGDAAGE